MKPSILFIALSCMTASSWANECKYTETRKANQNAAGVEKVQIIARRGVLNVQGADDAGVVRAEGKACATREDTLEQVLLQTSRKGNTLIIETLMPETSGSFLGTNDESWMDLRVDVPAHLALEIEDSSGETMVRNVGQTVVRDGSGELRIESVTGDLKVDDSSGALHIKNVRGSVEVRDDSGELHIEDVTGDVLVPNDGSGELRIRNIQGNVHVESDGSGGLSIETVRNNVRIDDDGSGSIYVRDVGANLLIGSDGSGDIEVQEVRGSFRLESDGSGGVRHRQVSGDVSVPD